MGRGPIALIQLLEGSTCDLCQKLKTIKILSRVLQLFMKTEIKKNLDNQK